MTILEELFDPILVGYTLIDNDSVFGKVYKKIISNNEYFMYARFLENHMYYEIEEYLVVDNEPKYTRHIASLIKLHTLKDYYTVLLNKTNFSGCVYRPVLEAELRGFFIDSILLDL